jgi:hypothetical protein
MVRLSDGLDLLTTAKIMAVQLNEMPERLLGFEPKVKRPGPDNP